MSEAVGVLAQDFAIEEFPYWKCNLYHMYLFEKDMQQPNSTQEQAAEKNFSVQWAW